MYRVKTLKCLQNCTLPFIKMQFMRICVALPIKNRRGSSSPVLWICMEIKQPRKPTLFAVTGFVQSELSVTVIVSELNHIT